MKTIYYTLTTRDNGAMAAGFDSVIDSGRQTVMLRRQAPEGRSLGGDNVIDLAAWRAANLEEDWDAPEGPAWESGEADWEEPFEAPRRTRRSHGATAAAELALIFGMLGTLAALVARVLLF